MTATARPESADKSLRVIMAGGGTGGHLFPGLSVAQEIRRRGGTVLFVGTAGGLETQHVPRAGFELELVRVHPLKRVSMATRMRSVVLLPAAIVRSGALIKRFRPHVAVGLGGYASGPVMVAAWLRRIPVVLLEQNTVPGMTNRLLSRLARTVVIAFPEAAERFPSGRSALLGNPIREELVEAFKDTETKPTPKGPLCLLVLGGSQGARALNELMMAATERIKSLGIRIVHQTGPADAERVEKAYAEAGVNALVRPFFDNMAEVYGQAHMALCRAGAGTIAELAVAGLPALLIPFPYAADDHQTLNARAVAASGGAIVLPQAGLTEDRLMAELALLVQDGNRRREMARAMKTFGKPDSAQRVSDLLALTAGSAGA